MFTITTTQAATPAGAGKVTAKGHGKQRTVRVDFTKSPEANHAAAVGALLDVLASPLQQAKLQHPSGAQRVRWEAISAHGGKNRWTIDV